MEIETVQDEAKQIEPEPFVGLEAAEVREAEEETAAAAAALE